MLRILNFIKKLFAKRPEWILTPDKDGTYTLEKWDPSIGMYLSEAVYVKTREEADTIIENLERPIIYQET